MNLEIARIRRILRNNPQKGLELTADFLKKTAFLDKNVKFMLAKEIEELVKFSQSVFEDLYLKKDKNINETVLKAMVSSSKNIFDNSGLKYTAVKEISTALLLIESGKTDFAVSLIKKRAKTAQYRAETIINTLQMASNRADHFETMLKNGVENFKYSGSAHAARQFCKEHLNKIYNYEEIKIMNNGQGLPVMYFCGGYNCRHRWTAIV